MKLVGIVAMSQSRAIGLNGTMPWHCPADLKLFRKLTLGHVTVMGRATFDSLPRPLPGRLNVVITRNPQPGFPPGVLAVPSPEAILDPGFPALAANLALSQGIELVSPAIMIIGGGAIYSRFLPLLSELWVSRIPGDFQADTWFPEFEPMFRLAETSPQDGFTLEHYLRA